MLKNTFQHLQGVGPAREAGWWGAGILTWDALARSERVKAAVARALEESAARLEGRDARYFADALPSTQRWRIYPDFWAETVFLDIETTGLSAGESQVTVVGLLDKNGYRAFVRGDNADDLPAALAPYRLIVTFNGGSFDLPFIAAQFGAWCFAHAGHLDLRHTMRQLGYTGGLKRIERVTRTGRTSVLANLGGADPVTLWRMAQEGEPGALSTLLRYNAEDVASLPKLAALAVGQLSAGTPLATSPGPEFPEFDCTKLPFDRSLVDYLGERKSYRS